ncbi:energy transducer TonB [Emticicia sp. BO119]|uniref:energy transducer TonB n=1 Tax=Emticicia sp. BO119 TaxID=2757768 RepID=UPI0015F03C41|nr:energy transducer TonB [Emticicia sp. BO119]MBA4848856.1 energy transducer TonB [Emticicia sp. BO119]
MKKLICILTMTMFSVTIAFAQKNKPVFEQVDQTPEYPGGMPAMFEFIGKNLKYPKEAQKNKIQGKVMIKLIIEEDGSISETVITQSLGYGCDEEVTRVVKAMPKWVPGKKDNELVRTSMVLPIMFALEGKSSK